ncbi:serine/arginine-rich splicing factor RS40-like isoform X1 [Salvia splendens]|uniref:serine/arginine-rich splicing factor RS40-like isoform X1 n=2 Tax=Salvia splendens TaxID=180675 RepID=UPI001C274D25|nr:serine/arginine-rich splicing factor RS40-like isoform X1 [Salvia splendens]XP_042034078.1 serine/arginine-rich splicing factor RS40-like isoform X1 [Salvia splendens]XP_042034079.1 serine/arginine-rich splicing factor RS40-like isoform X1 [Salvia splendens]
MGLPIYDGSLDTSEEVSYKLAAVNSLRIGDIKRRLLNIFLLSGFAFVYMEDERDAEDAIRALDRIEFGKKGRRLRVEWTKQERSSRRPESSKKTSSNTRPSKTLFVINFDPYHTRTRDLERHFDPYGKILNIRVRRNFAFIQFESLEDASKALDATNMSKLLDRVITVEFAIKDDDDRRNGNSPDRVRDRSPRRGYDRARSQSPYRRERGSPDYGHSRGRSPSPYRRERASPDYTRGSSQSPNRKERGSPNRKVRRSPIRRERASPDYTRGSSQSPNRKERGSPNRKVRRSPIRKERDSSDRKERESPDRKVRGSPDRKERGSPNRKEREHRRDHERSPSPEKEEGETTDHNNEQSLSPQTKNSNGDISNGLNPGKSGSPGYDCVPGASPQREKTEKASNPDEFARERSPAYSDGESPPPDRFGSQSPGAREKY